MNLTFGEFGTGASWGFRCRTNEQSSGIKWGWCNRRRPKQREFKFWSFWADVFWFWCSFYYENPQCCNEVIQVDGNSPYTVLLMLHFFFGYFVERGKAYWGLVWLIKAHLSDLPVCVSWNIDWVLNFVGLLLIGLYIYIYIYNLWIVIVVYRNGGLLDGRAKE